MRQLIFQGKEGEAAKIIDKYFVKGPHGMRYLPMGSLKLDFGHQEVADYERVLNLDDATVTTHYSYNGTRFQRTVFASQADDVIIIRITADRPSAISFT